jgi:hypothetical protein
MSEVTVQDIIKAKEIVRNNGMDCSLPDSKLEIAKNIAKAAGYTVQKTEQNTATPPSTEPAVNPPTYTPEKIAQALDIATAAGYTVKKAPVQEQPAQPTPAPATQPATPDNNTQSAQTAVSTIEPPAKNQEDINYGWIEQVAASML